MSSSLNLNTELFLWAFFALGVIYLIIGIIASMGIKNHHDYFLGGGQMGLVSITLSLVATQIGGGAVLGVANESFNSGIMGIAYNIGMVLGFLALGFGLAGKLKDMNVATVAEIFETEYGSPSLKKVASLLSIFSLFGILVAQVVSSHSLLKGLGLDQWWVLALFWGVIIAYTVVGGLKAVVYTDVLQIMIVIVIFLAVYFISLHHSLVNGLPAPPFLNFMGGVPAHTENVFHFDWVKVWPLFLMPMFFSMVEQDLAQRFFSIKNRRLAMLSAFISAIIILFFSIIPVHFGMKAKMMGLVPPEGASVLVWCLQSIVSPAWVAAVAIGLTAVIISTACSLLCAVSSNIVLDFRNEKSAIFRWRWFSESMTLLVGVAAVFIGISYDNILSVLVKSYELPVVCMLFPLLFAFFRPRGQLRQDARYFRAVWASFLVGIASFTLQQIFPQTFVLPWGIPKELFSMLLSGSSFFFVLFFTKRS